MPRSPNNVNWSPPIYPQKPSPKPINTEYGYKTINKGTRLSALILLEVLS